MEKEGLFPVLIDLLKTFDSFCVEHSLRYYLFAGSLLGAVRHQGIIPWDDDVDVCMPREDYDKLISLHKEFKSPYFLQSIALDNGYNKTFAKLRNSYTTEIPYKDAAFSFNHGAFIDIFPLDNVCNSKKMLHIQIIEMKAIEGILHFYSRYYSKINGLGLSGTKKVFFYCMLLLFKLRIITPGRINSLLHKVACRYNRSNTKYIGTISFSYDNARFIYPRDWLNKTIRTKFETIETYIPEDYDLILRTSYGDYMKPNRQPSEHGNIVFDAQKPYQDYTSENKEYLLSIWKRYHNIG